MPFTKCPNCRKVQQVTPKLLHKQVGCMAERCGSTFKAQEYRLHSGLMSRIVFMFVIGFAIFMLVRWVWINAAWIASQLG